MPWKTYSEQFKRDAVAMYENTLEASLKTTAEDLGINRITLRAWVQQLGTGAKARSLQTTTPANEAKTLTDAERLRQLERENAKLREERDILCKAAKYFIEETNW